MTEALDLLATGAAGILGRRLTDREIDLFRNYLNLLLEWQRVARLVGSTRLDWIIEHLLLDSLVFWRAIPRKVRSMIDIGSGAGIPGIPLKITSVDDVDLVLVESRRRRASFLAAVVRSLALDRTTVLNARAEELGEEFRERFDAVVARCAGDVSEVLPVASRFRAPQGTVIVAGPPTPRPLTQGSWLEVEGVGPGTTRWFAVYGPNS